MSEPQPRKRLDSGIDCKDPYDTNDCGKCKDSPSERRQCISLCTTTNDVCKRSAIPGLPTCWQHSESHIPMLQRKEITPRKSPCADCDNREPGLTLHMHPDNEANDVTDIRKFVEKYEGYSAIYPILGKRIAELNGNKICIFEAYRDSIEWDQVKQLLQKCEKDMVAFNIDVHDGEHANIIVVSHLLKTIEHFDPQGTCDDLMSNSYFRAGFTSILPEYTFVSSQETCPNIFFEGSGEYTSYLGPQSVLNIERPGSKYEGTCVVWCYWFLHHRIQYPRLSARDILNKMMHELDTVVPGFDAEQRISDFAFLLALTIPISLLSEETVCRRVDDERTCESMSSWHVDNYEVKLNSRPSKQDQDCNETSSLDDLESLARSHGMRFYSGWFQTHESKRNELLKKLGCSV